MPEEEEVYAQEEEEDDDEESGKKLELKRTAKPSARKPLPRPRSPSYSPPGYHDRGGQQPKKWKGLKHVIRGQLYYSTGSQRNKGPGKRKR